ncbi:MULTISPECIES: membrane protein [Protofrankia]|uniref:Membrane protein n=1 Tax=Protofrankia coriariae TaxID=1562887 RepID=A0ABR5EZE6_9ACTN|nr:MULTISPECIES: membrane protein [Protofrankia]KLL09829.1 membrane protein [Protofrankia coriariae]ONH35608.1 hypothetical protein BL254_09875 [Protofrankia sp. BMG5.30]
MPSSSHSRTHGREPVAPKVPEITALFWVVKILTTGMGEATSDYLAHLSLVLAGAVGILGLALALWLQFRARSYSAPVYWFAVMMVAVFGTMAADGPPIGHIGSTVFYIVVLATVFYAWHRREGTLSIHSIVTCRRETYYWLTVLATFALGTAMGDLTADSLHFGYLPSAILFTAVILVPAVAWWRFGLGEVVAFWSAYVVTRPLGASFADWLGKPAGRSGVGLGDGLVALAALAALIVIVVLVGYLMVTRGGIQRGAVETVESAVVGGGGTSNDDVNAPGLPQQARSWFSQVKVD